MLPDFSSRGGEDAAVATVGFFSAQRAHVEKLPLGRRSRWSVATGKVDDRKTAVTLLSQHSEPYAQPLSADADYDLLFDTLRVSRSDGYGRLSTC